MSGSWGERVTVVLHRVPESEDFEGGYEAVTIAGVPYGVSVTSSDPDSTEEALSRLLDALRAFGFAGRVAVEDTTYIGSVQRFEVQTS